MIIPGPDTVVVLSADEDRALAGRLVEALAAKGISAITGYDGPPTKRWEPAFARFLDECSLALVVWTKSLEAKLTQNQDALHKPIITEEIEYARDRKKPLLRVQCEKFDVAFAPNFGARYEIEEKNASDVSRFEKDGEFLRLVKDLNHNLPAGRRFRPVRSIDETIQQWFAKSQSRRVEELCGKIVQRRIVILTAQEVMAELLFGALSESRLRGYQSQNCLCRLDP